MTSPDLTPTPPADTRQQAVQRLRDTLSVVQGSIPTYSSRHALMGDALADLNILAAALVSSSPALPELPEAEEWDGATRWDMPCGIHDVTAEPGAVTCADEGLTPAEARLLASTLLAAADVAEEGEARHPCDQTHPHAPHTYTLYAEGGVEDGVRCDGRATPADVAEEQQP